MRGENELPNSWFRFYHEWDSDPKVQMMPEAMQRRLAMLFCWRCKGETFHETRAAFHWRVSETDMEETRLLFMRQGFIDEHWNLLNWNRRQFLSDSSTDRVRRHRQALKQVETLQETKGNVTETGLSASVSVSVSESASVFDSGEELSAANWLLEELGAVADNGVRRVAADAIRLLGKEGGTIQTAAEYILQAGHRAREQGEVINRFWFTDQRYRPVAPKKSKRQLEREAREEAFMKGEDEA